MEEIEDYKTYVDNTLGKEVLISHVGDEEFECFGSCYCEKGFSTSSRSISDFKSRGLVKGMSYLLAAVSSLQAIKLAGDHFSEKCQELYSDDVCDEEYILSNLDSCREISGERSEISGVKERIYYCYGNCVERTNPRENHVRPTPSEMGIDCTKLKREGKISVRSDELHPKRISKMTFTSQMLNMARVRFQQKYLNEFCQEESAIEYTYHQNVPYTSRVTGVKRVTEYESPQLGYMCTASKLTFQLRNIHCRLMKPNPTANNSPYWDKKWWNKKKEWDKS